MICPCVDCLIIAICKNKVRKNHGVTGLQCSILSNYLVNDGLSSTDIDQKLGEAWEVFGLTVTKEGDLIVK